MYSATASLQLITPRSWCALLSSSLSSKKRSHALLSVCIVLDDIRFMMRFFYMNIINLWFNFQSSGVIKKVIVYGAPRSGSQRSNNKSLLISFFKRVGRFLSQYDEWWGMKLAVMTSINRQQLVICAMRFLNRALRLYDTLGVCFALLLLHRQMLCTSKPGEIVGNINYNCVSLKLWYRMEQSFILRTSTNPYVKGELLSGRSTKEIATLYLFKSRIKLTLYETPRSWNRLHSRSVWNTTTFELSKLKKWSVNFILWQPIL